MYPFTILFKTILSGHDAGTENVAAELYCRPSAVLKKRSIIYIRLD